MKKELPFLQYLKNVKPRDLVYPGVFALFFGIVIVLFFFTMQFISQSINKAFSLEKNGASQALDIERYKTVARKLNIPVNPEQSGATVPTTSPEIVTAQATGTSTAKKAVFDKKSITIIVRNSTTKRGAGAALAKALEDSGFQRPQTGNEPQPYKTTTILLKESKNDYRPSLLETVRTIYPDVAVTTAPESNEADAIVVIGGR